ncbi:hypothetical protein APED_25925 [Acanthopleuribacter pedis]
MTQYDQKHLARLGYCYRRMVLWWVGQFIYRGRVGNQNRRRRGHQNQPPLALEMVHNFFLSQQRLKSVSSLQKQEQTKNTQRFTYAQGLLLRKWGLC